MIEITRKKGTKKRPSMSMWSLRSTFGPMCSSGIFINVGHSTFWLVTVDIYIGATTSPDDDPGNTVYPGAFKYGSGHVVEEFVSGKSIRLGATAYCTDCYQKKRIEIHTNKETVNEAYIYNPRNSYQNYNVVVKLSKKVTHIYMGCLKPNFGSANYWSVGYLSPLLKDQKYRTIGINTRLSLGGGVGCIAWYGTQHNPSAPRSADGTPRADAGTLAVMGDAKQMNGNFLKGANFIDYGATLFVVLWMSIPILIDGKEISTFSIISSYSKAQELAWILKEWISAGQLLLTNFAELLSGMESDIKMKTLEEKSLEEISY